MSVGRCSESTEDPEQGQVTNVYERYMKTLGLRVKVMEIRRVAEELQVRSKTVRELTEACDHDETMVYASISRQQVAVV